MPAAAAPSAVDDVLKPLLCTAGRDDGAHNQVGILLCERDAPGQFSKRPSLAFQPSGFQSTPSALTLAKKQSTTPTPKLLGKLGSSKAGGRHGARRHTVTSAAPLWPLEQLELDLEAEK